MSGIYIKGMEMPQEGEMVCIEIFASGTVMRHYDLTNRKIATAISVPDHGRLIDADAMCGGVYANHHPGRGGRRMSDYIKREDALMAILALEDRDIPEDRYPDTEFAFNEGLVHAANEVADLPAAVVVERKVGKWIKYAPYNSDMMTCSECEKYWILDGDQYDYHFCPNCGADMRPKEEEI